jgi:arsenite methyltransferase
MDNTAIYEEVQRHYGQAAKSLDPVYGQIVARAFGYSTEELAVVPEDAQLGLSCGNPLALANLREAFHLTLPVLAILICLSREKP